MALVRVFAAAAAAALFFTPLGTLADTHPDLTSVASVSFAAGSVHGDIEYTGKHAKHHRHHRSKAHRHRKHRGHHGKAHAAN